jgi:hypothetical protein
LTLLRGYRFGQFDDQVGERAVLDGDPHRDDVDLAGQLRITRPTALAAPVLVGIRFTAPDRPRRKSLCGQSRITWSLVWLWIVVIRPCWIPNARCSTDTIGATQFAVQDAFEMSWCSTGL